MAYTPASLTCTQTSPGGGPQTWHYTHATDPHTDVDATDYFTVDQKTRGMRLYDIVHVIDIDTATLTVHYVSAIDSDGNRTVSAATLS